MADILKLALKFINAAGIKNFRQKFHEITLLLMKLEKLNSPLNAEALFLKYRRSLSLSRTGVTITTEFPKNVGV